VTLTPKQTINIIFCVRFFFYFFGQDREKKKKGKKKGKKGQRSYTSEKDRQ